VLTRLVILWLLAEQRHHGYRIRKILSDPGLRFWFPIDDAQIYSMLRTLVKEGRARKVATEREGRRPRRTLYAITPAGRAHYADLLRWAWRHAPSATDPVQLALAASGDLPDGEVGDLAAERLRALERRLAQLDELRSAAPSPAMVARERARIRAEVDWLHSWRRA
jgi:DNA-binding PadR family transcriptional regulator